MDYVKLLNKLDKDPNGEDQGLRLRTAVVDAVNSDGTVDLIMSGGLVPDVPVLDSAPVYDDAVVQVLTTRGGMIVLGSSGGTSWTTYVPSFTTSGGGGSVGNGVITGRYHRRPDLCLVWGYMRFGNSGQSGGSNFWRVSLPFTSANVTNAKWLGDAEFLDNSAGATGHRGGYCTIGPNATYAEFFVDGLATAQQVTSTIPFAWGPDDSLRFQIEYEPVN